MKVSRTVSYALRAVLQLAEAQSDVPIPCSQIASEGQMPERFLLQVMRHLVAHGILGSTRGVVGGYRLLRSPEDISVLEIIEAIEGPMDAPDGGDVTSGTSSQDRLRVALDQVTDTTRHQLASIKVADLLPATQAPS